MNIFILDEDPREAARMQCDKHVVKMTLETAQLLSTAHQVNGTSVNKNKIYKETHINHPCAKWVRENPENYQWTLQHFKELLKEFEKRYGKKHACEKLLPHLEKPPNFPKNKIKEKRTPFAQAVPEKYRDEDAVKAYQDYYINEKHEFAEWKKLKNKPKWYKENIAQLTT